METQKKMLPIGIENFEELRSFNYYYVDKTGMIRDLLANRVKVTLFTRPRRFGKSLNMSMLENFFKLDGDKHLFDGLEISKEPSLCDRHMGKYPVIFVTLKGIGKPTYDEAFQRSVELIIETAWKFNFLLDSDKLDEMDKKNYKKLLDENMNKTTLCSSLKLLSQLLQKHFGTNTILLIDEYDVPFDKAYTHGYYDSMVFLIRDLFYEALKSNDSLEFSVLTGCLRVSKESILTGLNNLRDLPVSDDRFGEYFGFEDNEVKDLLTHYDLLDHYEDIKKWYDGYQIGSTKVYCPWDVLNYIDLLRKNPRRKPGNYWINTSGNDAVKRFVEIADEKTIGEIERLGEGKSIEKKVNENLTYPDMYNNIDNLWSLLYMTGYLTSEGETEGGLLKLRIPNLEIWAVFVDQIRAYFYDFVRSDPKRLNRFYNALQRGYFRTVQEIFSYYLRKSISIRDTMEEDDRKEIFYQGVMIGVLTVNENWLPVSNRESGDGYADVLVKPKERDLTFGIVIELKYDKNLDKACEDALEQIKKKRYVEELSNQGVKKILTYGIGCYKKECKVVLGRK